jgi:two-component system, NtrC family, sensor kinase
MSSSAIEGAGSARGVDGFRTLVDGLSDAAVIVDRELRPLVWNKAYVETVGVRPRRFLSLVEEQRTPCHDLFELECCKSDCLARRCFSGGRGVRVHELHGKSRHSDAGDKTLIVSAIPLRNGAGEVVAALEIYRDVTAEARVQERFRGLLERERERAETLEQLVQKRTAELERSLEELRATRAQLVQTEKLSSLGQLVAGIAHEINNPINFIYGNLDFLEEYVRSFKRLIEAARVAKLDEADRRRIEELRAEVEYDYIDKDCERLLGSIRSGAERASRIVRDLRTFIHGGRSQMDPVQLTQCVETTLSLITHETKDRITIDRDYGPDLPLVLGNEGQLSQVFMNLLINAVQAINGPGTVTVRLRAQDAGVLAEVHDTGCGISEEDQLKVFDPFFTTKAVGEGTGLGLSISYSIIDGHGGKISVQSKPGAGATFRVWLPALAR